MVRTPESHKRHFPLLFPHIVCSFMGNNTMADVRERFMDLRGTLFPSQRPFKFHLYPIAGLEHPDRAWEDGKRMGLRKCKHIFLSMDEISEGGPPISQAAYQQQITTFIGHLQKIIPDETFPIWISTMLSHPIKSNQCHSPILPRTTNHPCDDVLLDLFKRRTLPSRIKLLDNRELVMPLWSEEASEILSLVALRTFVFVGKGVADWRAVGQRGTVKGLERNGGLEPNFELIPYRDWS